MDKKGIAAVIITLIVLAVASAGVTYLIFKDEGEPSLQTCLQQNGYTCSASETCSGIWLSASDTSSCCDVGCTTSVVGTQSINVDLAELGFSGSVKEVIDVETNDNIQFNQQGNILSFDSSVKPTDVQAIKVLLNNPQWKDIRNRNVNPIVPTGDVYKNVDNSHITIGNSKVELKFDKNTGTIADLVNKQTGKSYLTGSNSNNFVLYYSNEGDIWKATEYKTTGSGENIKTILTSEVIQGRKQSLSSYSFDESTNQITLHLKYNALQDNGKTYNIEVEELITVNSNDELTTWKLKINNRDAGTVISAVYPMFSDLKKISNDGYYINTQGFGSMILDPLTQFSKRFFSWPEETAPLARQWHEYGNSEEGLYLAAYDKDLVYKTFNFGNRKGNEIYSGKPDPLSQSISSKAELSVKTYFFAGPNQNWNSFNFAVGIHEEDWHWSADRYREWFMSWAETPDVPDWYKENFDFAFNGVLTQNDRVQTRYLDMKNTYTRKNQMVSWSGWHKCGFNDCYPEYVPIPKTGDAVCSQASHQFKCFDWAGEQNLKNAIRDIHKRGGRVGLYTNGHHIEVGTQTYTNTGGDFKTRKSGSWDAIDRNGNAYYEVWKLRTFAVPDPFVTEWQNTYATYAKKIAEYGADGIQVDEVGLLIPQLCYNKNHGHPTPANGPAIGTLTFLRKTRDAVKKINPNFVIYPEYHFDAFVQYLDDPGGWCCGDYGKTTEGETGLTVISLPGIYRYTLPDYPRILHEPTKNARNNYAYSFILGNRFSPDPDFSDYQSAVSYAALAKQAKDYMINGRFMDTMGLTMNDQNIEGRIHLSKNRDSFVVALWSTASGGSGGEQPSESGSEGVDITQTQCYKDCMAEAGNTEATCDAWCASAGEENE